MIFTLQSKCESICVYLDPDSGTCLKHINEQHGIAHFNFCIALLYLVNTVISK